MRVLRLTQGQHTVVDDDVYEWASKVKWRAQRGKFTFYAVREVLLFGGKSKSVYLHREILGSAPGECVDHVDGDGLHNLRENLRSCKVQENNCNARKRRTNTSGFKGVSFFKRDGTWKAQISSGRKNKHLGYFDTPEDAARCYDRAAARAHGAFARLNFSEKGAGCEKTT